MFRKTNRGETPRDPAQEAAEDYLEPSQANDPHDKPHGDDWGSGQEQAEEYIPSWEQPSILRRVCHSALSAGRRCLSWARNTFLPRVRAACSRGRRSLYPRIQGAVSRLHDSQLAGIAERHWFRATPRARRAALALCTVSAAILFVVGIRAWLVGEPQVEPLQGTAVAAGAPVRVHGVDQPILFHVRVGSPDVVCMASAGKRRQMAGAAASQILPVVASRPEQVVVVCLRDLPLSYSLLAASDQRRIQQRFGAAAARRYESAVAALLNATINAVEQEHPRAVLSVLGLPVEPEEAGVSLEIARQSNARYATVIDGLGPLVSPRKLVVFGSTLDETTLARMGMREALRLRDGRPIVFQVNTGWQALVDSDGLDYQEYVLAHASGRLDRHRGSPRHGSREPEVQVLLGDDPNWEP
ncbi:MAG: hypothetical protein ACYTAQ_03015 [Planctomycetota bacterium]|jgi:hypothetical protein